MELGGADGDVLEVELWLSINKPRLTARDVNDCFQKRLTTLLTAVRPENMGLQSNCVEMAGRGRLRLVYSVCGQGWIYRYGDAEKWTNIVELGFCLLQEPVENTGRQVHFSAEK